MDYTQMPLAVAALLYIVKLCIDTMKDMKVGKGDSSVKAPLSESFRRDVYAMKTEIHDLHDWHNKEDEDGRKIWYVKQSLEEGISDLNTNVKENTLVLKGLTAVIKNIDTE